MALSRVVRLIRVRLVFVNLNPINDTYHGLVCYHPLVFVFALTYFSKKRPKVCSKEAWLVSHRTDPDVKIDF